jgi:nucleoside-diphosphate-sugar epimerase
MATSVLIAGYGDLGSAVADRLLQTGINVIGLSRRHKPHQTGVQLIQADVTVPEQLAVLDNIQPTIVLYCVSADAQTDADYQQHYVNGLRHVLDRVQHSSALQHVFFVSSTRVYGQTGDAWLDESTLPMPADFGGERLLEAEQLLEQSGVSHTILRLSGIYGPGRTRMLRLAQMPSQWPTGNVWTNRIHRDDAARWIFHLIDCVLKGDQPEACYLVTDDASVAQYEVLGWLAGQMGVAGIPATPPVRGGKRLSNAKMRATGFKLTYPDYRAGYDSLLQNMASEDES